MQDENNTVAPAEETVAAPVEEAAPAEEAAPVEEAAPAEEAAPVEEVAVTNGPKLFFNKLEVISEGTREVEGITHRTVSLIDGSSQDITEEEYEKIHAAA